MRLVRRVLGTLVVLTLAYLLLWPVPIDPMAWTPPAAPTPAPTGSLVGGERWLVGKGTGPEALAFGPDGALYTGYADGRIVRTRDGKTLETVAETGGRPLGLVVDAAGDVIVADALRGLLRVSSAGQVRVLAAALDGKAFRFTDDVALASDGTIYFTDASMRWGFHEEKMDIVEHRPSGRVLAYHPDTQGVTVVASGLAFANGVALAPDGSYLLVNETGAFRVTRLWLTGPKQGQSEPFAENLPGLPDNITIAPRGGAWVALFSPRVPAFDKLLPYPFVRKIVVRLPEMVQPKPVHAALVVHLDETGAIDHWLEDRRPSAYAPVTSCRERDGKLYLGSLTADAIAVFPAP